MAGIVICRAETVNAVHPGRERRFEPARGGRVGQPPEVTEAPARYFDLGRCRRFKGFLFLLENFGIVKYDFFCTEFDNFDFVGTAMHNKSSLPRISQSDHANQESYLSQTLCHFR